MTNGWIIPDDWDGETYVPVILCCPSSSKWLSILGGAVSQMGNAWSYDADTGDILTARDIGLEVYESMSGCNELITAINELRIAISVNACGCPVGQGSDNDDGTRGGPVPGPVGDIVYQEPSVTPDRDCKAANLVHETLLDVFTELNKYNVDDMATLGLALTTGLVASIIASAIATPMAGVIVAVAGVTAVFVGKLISILVDLGNIVSVMTAQQTQLVCDLYTSTQASTAKATYLATLTAGGATALEAELVGLLMTNALMNTLYFDTKELEAFWPTYTGPVDCQVCVVEPTDWMLVPDGNWPGGFTTDAGTLGTGTIDNTGGVFELTAQERHDQPGVYCIGIVVSAHWDSQSNKGTLTSDPIVVTTLDGIDYISQSGSPLTLTVGVRGDACGLMPYSQAPSFVPGSLDRFLAVYYQASGPFTMEFQVDTPPVLCP